MHAQASVEKAEAVTLPTAHQQVYDAMRTRWVVGDPAAAREQVAALADRFGVDEVMVHPVAGEHDGAEVTRSAGRARTLELLADHL
jgi:alkanesulfonate monooxygenase SsuD/methylene tetrahydromethanopterin reductase-like flavin-dependent oxidoreductase (luciferase family)